MATPIELAAKALKEQRYAEAAALFDDLHRQQPGNAKLAFLKAQAYQGMGDLERARVAFTEVAGSEEPRLADLARRSLSALPTATPVPAAPESAGVKAGFVMPSLKGGSLPKVPPKAVPAPEPKPERSLDSSSAPLSEPAAPQPPAAPIPPQPPVLEECPECGEPLREDRRDRPWCDCGWNKPGVAQAHRIFLTHLKAYARTLRVTLEIKQRGDVFVVGEDVRVRHEGTQLAPVEPRLVFRVDAGSPYLQRADLDLVVPKIDERAVFRIRQAGNDVEVGRLLSWDELYEELKGQGLRPGRPGTGGLPALLREYSPIPEDTLRRIEATYGESGFGRGLLAEGVCSLQALLEYALGAARVILPLHHQANQIAHVLYGGGALTLEAFREALVNQVKAPQPITELVGPIVGDEAIDEARAELEGIRIQEPERERLGDVLVQMGLLRHSDLAYALGVQRRENKLLGKVLTEIGLVPEEALVEALKRQEVKASLRMEGAVRLGSLLVEHKACTLKDVARALLAQIGDSRPLGELLVDAGIITPEQLVAAIAEQEARLDRLLEQRLPSALKGARLADMQGAPKRDLASAPLRADTRPGDVSKARRKQPGRGSRGRRARHRRPWFLDWRLWLLTALLGGGGAFAYQLTQPTYAAPAPGRFEPPLLKVKVTNSTQAATQRLAIYAPDSPGNLVTTAYGEAERHLEDPNPLGDGLLWMPGHSLPPAMLTMAAQVSGDPSLPSKSPESGLEAVVDELDAPRPDTTAVTEAAREGYRLMLAERPLEAEKLLTEAIAASPGDSDSLIALGIAQRLIGKPQDSETTLLKAVLMAKSKAMVLGEIAATRLTAGNAQGAAEAFVQALQREPDSLATLVRLGMVRLRQNRPEDAKDAFESILKRDRQHPMAHLQLGLMAEARDPRGARGHFHLAAEGFQALAETRAAQAEVLKAQGDTVGEIRAWQDVIKANTTLAIALLEAGKTCATEHQVAGAQGYWSAAKVTMRTGALPHAWMGDAYEGLKQYRQAATEWLLASRIAPDDPYPLYQIGQLAKSRGNAREAKLYLQTASTLDPKSEIAFLAKTALRDVH